MPQNFFKTKVMKKINLAPFYILLCFVIAVVGCKKDEDNPDGGSGGGGGADQPIVLDCSVSSDLTLMDHNPNGVDYILDCNLSVAADLKIEPGTIIQINDGRNINVTQNGSLAAVGTASKQIVFKGESGGSATWEYIIINSTSPKNRLDYVLIENAGNNNGWGSLRPETSAVYLEGRLSMTNTTITGSDGINFTVTDVITESTLTDFSGNIFRDAASHPIRVTPRVANNLDFASCTFSGNGASSIQIVEGVSSSRSDIEEDVVWQRAPLPYFVDVDIRVEESLTIESGNEIIFASGTGIDVPSNTGGFLKIDGTDANHVIMRGEVAVAGAWLGLDIKTNNPQNIFNYLDIADGGQRDLTFVDFEGNIMLTSGEARLTINNCTSTRADCDVILDTALGDNQTFENNSPNISMICEN